MAGHYAMQFIDGQTSARPGGDWREGQQPGVSLSWPALQGDRRGPDHRRQPASPFRNGTKAPAMNEITQVLAAIEQGDPQAAAQLLPLVYTELRRLAAAQMAREKPGQTLDPTALVHEAYLRLAGAASFGNHTHFYAAAAEAMRRILVENARRKGRIKRGGGRHRDAVELDALSVEMPDDELLALHDALERFALHDSVKAKLVELRFFGGMSLPEIAEHLNISISTAERGWRYARAWLYTAMTGEDKSPSR
jgi:RNA polymerase sigma factor (TIGR02999 family)